MKSIILISCLALTINSCTNIHNHEINKNNRLAGAQPAPTYATTNMFASRSIVSEDLPILPRDVLWVFVFYQDPSSHERGSGKEIARRLKPQEFLSNFASYKSEAKSENKQLIIIAQSKIGKWVHDHITYRGKSLARARYFNPRMDGVYLGAEIPLD